MISASFDCLAEYTAAANRIKKVEHETTDKSAVQKIERKKKQKSLVLECSRQPADNYPQTVVIKYEVVIKTDIIADKQHTSVVAKQIWLKSVAYLIVFTKFIFFVCYGICCTKDPFLTMPNLSHPS